MGGGISVAQALFVHVAQQRFAVAAVTPVSQRIAVDRTVEIGRKFGKHRKGPVRLPHPEQQLLDEILGEGGKPVDCRIEDAKRTGEDFKKAKAALGDLARSEEDVMSYICYPDQTMKFLESRKAKEENVVRYAIEEA